MSSTDSRIEKAKKFLKENLVEIEKRDDLSQEEKAQRIINLFSGVCAGVAIQPIPFMDIFILTPLQVLMGERLAAIWGVPVKEASVGSVLKDISKIGFMGLGAMFFVTQSYKTFLPYFGAVTTIPMVYGCTYAIGNVLSELIYKRRAKGQSKLSKDQIREMWKVYKTKGQDKYKKGDEIEIK